MTETVYNSMEEWFARAEELFGKDKMNWKFVCPSCGHIASVKDWKDAEASQHEIAYSCVGRHLENSHEAFQQGESPCNYAGGGLFQINPVKVKAENGEFVKVFDFATVSDE